MPGTRPSVPALLVLAAILLLTACDRGDSDRRATVEGGPAALVDVPGQIVFPGPLLVVPGPRWDRHPPEDGPWRFRTFARILCLVREDGEGPLVLDLLPDAETAGFDFAITWDGEELDAAAVRREAGSSSGASTAAEPRGRSVTTTCSTSCATPTAAARPSSSRRRRRACG